MDGYNLSLYTRNDQEETFDWRPGLDFTRWVKAMKGDLDRLVSTDPSLHAGHRQSILPPVESALGSAAVDAIAATNWTTVPAPRFSCRAGQLCAPWRVTICL
jgi:hypothetical protein